MRGEGILEYSFLGGLALCDRRQDGELLGAKLPRTPMINPFLFFFPHQKLLFFLTNSSIVFDINNYISNRPSIIIKYIFNNT